MNTTLYIASGLILLAMMLAAWIYPPRRRPLLFLLRTLSLFFVFLFLWNPRFVHRKSRRIRPVLTFIQDVSASQKPYIHRSDSLANAWTNDKDLKKHFDIRRVYFAAGLYNRKPDSLPWQTAISQSLSSLHESHSSGNREAWILLTDGIQTAGKDYTYIARFWKNLRIYPVLLGDTTRFPDLSIEHTEYNRETGKGNFFPVNISFRYQGKKVPVETEVVISEKGHVLRREKLRFNSQRRYIKKHWSFQAKNPGWHTYKIILRPLDGEKNITNNTAYLRFRVIDRRANILILYGGLHPDAGALRRILETEKNYHITIHRNIPTGKTYDLIVAIQPTARQVEQIRQAGRPVWWITGIATEWKGLNTKAGWFQKRLSVSTPVNYIPEPAENFHLFQLPEPPAFPLPPLRDVYGNLTMETGTEVLWYGHLEGDTARVPLWVIYPTRYEAATFGQGLWRWYVQEKKNTSSVRYLREAVLRTAAFLMHKPHRGLLQVEHQRHYDAGTQAVILIRALNTLYEPRPDAHLVFRLHTPDGHHRTIPLFYENGVFKAYLDTLGPGFYRYEVHYRDYDLHRYGGFQVDSLPAEFRLRLAATSSLQQLARSTDGKLFFPDSTDNLRHLLLNDPFFKTRLKEQTRRIPLTDHSLWLWLAVLMLVLEWIYRKYRGRI